MSRPCCLVACCAVVALASPARAQDYPSRPVKAIVAVGAGGTGDIFMRVLGEELHRRWGQPVVVENRPGGASNIGARDKLSPGNLSGNLENDLTIREGESTPPPAAPWASAVTCACESGSSDVVFISTPTRRMRSCARVASGHAATAPPSSMMNSRRLMAPP